MGSSPLRFPAPRRSSLLSEELQLHLDPDLFPPSLNLYTPWLDALGSRLLLDPMTLSPMFTGASGPGTLLRVHPTMQVSLNQPAFCPVPANASFPETPSPADMGTFVRAVMACQGVQNFMTENLERPVKNWWNSRSSSTQTALITTGVVGVVALEGAFLATVIPDAARRRTFLPLVDGKRIALPRFNWGPVDVGVHLGPTSLQTDVQPRGGPNFQLSGGLTGPYDGDRLNWNVNLMIDLMPWINSATEPPGGARR